ncbi:hypothetical protein PZE06_03890 [Robertmurraya sp. DFI.2.37]|nr:hypothetical protein [Robertmurraya sp. DFI.2.37]MDF1507320.1 hypothetical protein [Robertmurraya sp. DFI.2.37]
MKRVDLEEVSSLNRDEQRVRRESTKRGSFGLERAGKTREMSE